MVRSQRGPAFDPGADGPRWLPRVSVPPAELFELQLVAASSLVLVPFVIVSTLAFPGFLGSRRLEVAAGILSAAGLCAAYALAFRGHRKSSSAILITVLLAGSWLAMLRSQDPVDQSLYALSALMAVTVAFALGHLALGTLASAATSTYVFLRGFVVGDAFGEPLVTIAFLVGGTLVAAIGPFLRSLERQRATKAEEAATTTGDHARGLVKDLHQAQALAHVGNWELDVPSGKGKWSPEMYHLFARDPKTFSPTYETSFESIHPDDRRAVHEEFQAAMAQRRDLDVDHRIRGADGSERVVNERAHFDYDEAGHPVRGSGTTQDITERKRGEQARQEVTRKEGEVRRLDELARMRMEFLNAAAHDFKTPLTPLRLQMSTLRNQGLLDARQAQGFDLMERNLRRLEALVDDMLDAARLQSGRLALRKQTMPLGPLVQEAVLAFQEQARQRRITLEVREPSLVRVDVDPGKAMQVLMNLVSNAVKYTPEGGHVRVGVEDRGDEALVVVQDDGLGLTKDQLAKLFGPFTRLHEDQAGVAKGTGLGLYISKGIVEQHGGRLWAESAGEGRGATFLAAWRKAPAARHGEARPDQPGDKT